MAFYSPAENEIILVKYFSHNGTQLGIFGVHYRIASRVPAGITLEEIAEAMSTLAKTPLSELLTTPATYLGTKVSSPYVEDQPLPVAFSDELAGAAGLNPLPGQVSGIITLLTGFIGRANRGRIYIPFIDEDDNDTDHTPTLGYMDRLDALGDAILVDQMITGAAGTAILAPVIFHRGDMTATAVDDFRPSQRWGTQRSRGDYGAPNPAVIT